MYEEASGVKKGKKKLTQGGGGRARLLPEDREVIEKEISSGLSTKASLSSLERGDTRGRSRENG